MNVGLCFVNRRMHLHLVIFTSWILWGKRALNQFLLSVLKERFLVFHVRLVGIRKLGLCAVLHFQIAQCYSGISPAFAIRSCSGKQSECDRRKFALTSSLSLMFFLGSWWMILTVHKIVLNFFFLTGDDFSVLLLPPSISKSYQCLNLNSANCSKLYHAKE